MSTTATGGETVSAAAAAAARPPRRRATTAQRRQWGAAYALIHPVLRDLHRDDHHPAGLRRLPVPVQEAADRRGDVRGLRELRARPDRPAASCPGSARMVLFLVVQVPIMLDPGPVLRPGAGQRADEADQVHPDGDLHAVRRSRRDRRVDVGLPVRTGLRPVRPGRRPRFGAPPPAFTLRTRNVLLDREHRELGVHRLQHDHHVRRACARSRPSCTRRRGSTEPARYGSPGPSRSPRSVRRSLLTIIFSIIGTFQLFNEPRLMGFLAPNGDRHRLVAEPLRVQHRLRQPGHQLRRRPLLPARLRDRGLSYIVQLSAQRKERRSRG